MDITFTFSEEFKNISAFSKGSKISLEDIDLFINILLRNAASRLNIDYNILRKLFISYNTEFLNFKENFFNKFQYMYIYSDEFKKMCDLIKMPLVNQKTERKNVIMCVKENNKNYTSEDCIKLFNMLSLEEKIKFIKEFNNTSITLTTLDISNLLK